MLGGKDVRVHRLAHALDQEVCPASGKLWERHREVPEGPCLHGPELFRVKGVGAGLIHGGPVRGAVGSPHGVVGDPEDNAFQNAVRLTWL